MKSHEYDLKSRDSSFPGTLIGRILTFILLLAVSNFLAGRAIAQPTDVIETFPTGLQPVALTSDGLNIWVACLSDSIVNKLRASDGALLGTFAIGRGPVDEVFDGANVWVTNQLDGHSNETPGERWRAPRHLRCRQLSIGNRL